MSPTVDSKPVPTSTTAKRLADQLVAMLPGAAVVQVRLQGPRTLWPHLRLVAEDEYGQALRVPRAKALTIARWIIRVFPGAGWAEGQTFDLRTAQLHGQGA